MVYMVTFTINIPQMLAYIAAPWILWVKQKNRGRLRFFSVEIGHLSPKHRGQSQGLKLMVDGKTTSNLLSCR